jgi:hypothetical protein
MPFVAEVSRKAQRPDPQFADKSVVEGFKSYRDAVIWVWKNRKSKTDKEAYDQAICAREIGLHAPHMSRCVNCDTLAPMNLSPDHVKAFQEYCGWYAVSQYIARTTQFTLMEEVIEERRNAA